MEGSKNELMQISFPVMKTIPLGVKETDTIQQVKTTYSAAQGVPRECLKSLVLDGQCLEEEKRLPDYNIRNGSIIKMFLDSEVTFHIYVNMLQLGKTIKLDVSKGDPIYTVKGKIQSKEGIVASGHDLIYLGEQLEDSQILEEYKVHEGATLYSMFRIGDEMKISVSAAHGRTVNLDVRSWYTIEMVKNMIESIEGIPEAKQILYLDNKKLENDIVLKDICVTMRAYNLKLVSGMQSCPLSLTMGFGDGIFEVGQAAIRASVEKLENHESTCVANQHVSILFAFDTFGFLALESVELLNRLQKVMDINVMCIAYQ